MNMRRTRLLDVAIEVIARDGARALTHRAVDAAAGLPAGSTSNLFRTRDALLTGVGDRLQELDETAWASLAPTPPSTLDQLARRLAEFISLIIGPQAAATRARIAIMAERPTSLAPHHQALLAAMATQLETLGVNDAHPRAMLIADLIDGIAFHCVTVRHNTAAPGPEDIANAVRALAMHHQDPGCASVH